MHFGNVLALAQQGCLLPNEAHKPQLNKVLKSIKAFQTRTEAAIAPLLETVGADQQADFFDVFGDDFPPDLSEPEQSQ